MMGSQVRCGGWVWKTCQGVFFFVFRKKQQINGKTTDVKGIFAYVADFLIALVISILYKEHGRF